MTGSLVLRKVRRAADADAMAVCLHLYRGVSGRICGWYIGPVGVTATGLDLPYLPRSKETLAPLAIVRALQAAEAASAPLCLVDPDDLWEPAWFVEG